MHLEERGRKILRKGVKFADMPVFADEQIELVSTPGRSRGRPLLSIFATPREIFAYKVMHFKLCGIPAPYPVLIDGYIYKRIELEAPHLLVSFPVLAVFCLAVPKMEEIPVRKPTLERTVSWNGMAQDR